MPITSPKWIRIDYERKKNSFFYFWICLSDASCILNYCLFYIDICVVSNYQFCLRWTAQCAFFYFFYFDQCFIPFWFVLKCKFSKVWSLNQRWISTVFSFNPTKCFENVFYRTFGTLWQLADELYSETFFLFFSKNLFATIILR